jgi:hypothetical protein
MLFFIWGCGVVVGSPEGAGQYMNRACLCDRDNMLLIIFSTISYNHRPSQVSLCLFAVYDPTSPSLDMYSQYSYCLIDMVCLPCHATFMS